MLSKFALLQLSISLLLSTSSKVQAEGFVPYKDAQCSERLTMYEDGEEAHDQELLITEQSSLRGIGKGDYYGPLTFPDADGVGQGGMKKVYWKTPEPGSHPDGPCVHFLMLDRPGDAWGAVTGLRGDIIMISNSEKCVYTALEPKAEVLTGVCCGSNECAQVDMGTHSYARRDMGLAAEDSKIPLSPASRASQVVKEKRSSGRKTADDSFREAGYEISDCKFASDVKPRREAGLQRMVSDAPLNCDQDEPCKFAIQQGTEDSTSISHSRSYTVSLENEVSVGIEAGLDLIGSASLSYSLSVGEAWETTEGTEITHSTISTVAYELPIVPGEKAFLTFRPKYECYQGKSDCRAQKGENDLRFTDDDVTVCNPITNGKGGFTVGEYFVVYT